MSPSLPPLPKTAHAAVAMSATTRVNRPATLERTIDIEPFSAIAIRPLPWNTASYFETLHIVREFAVPERGILASCGRLVRVPADQRDIESAPENSIREGERKEAPGQSLQTFPPVFAKTIRRHGPRSQPARPIFLSISPKRESARIQSNSR